MSALLHYIIEGIERDRVSIMLNRWRIKQQKAKLAVIEASQKHWNTALITYNEEDDMDLWEELRDFNFVPIMCQNYPECTMGVYWRYNYNLYYANGRWFLEEDDAMQYNYYCWECYRNKKAIFKEDFNLI